MTALREFECDSFATIRKTNSPMQQLYTHPLELHLALDSCWTVLGMVSHVTGVAPQSTQASKMMAHASHLCDKLQCKSGRVLPCCNAPSMKNAHPLGTASNGLEQVMALYLVRYGPSPFPDTLSSL